MRETWIWEQAAEITRPFWLILDPEHGFLHIAGEPVSDTGGHRLTREHDRRARRSSLRDSSGDVTSHATSQAATDHLTFNFAATFAPPKPAWIPHHDFATHRSAQTFAT
jgi:hypothetical protein